MKESHYIENRIFYHDTDAGGVVYYAKYLEHLEEARFEFCKQKGVDSAEYADKGILFPVVHLNVEYKAPARYGDIIRIHTVIEKVGNSSIHFLQEIKKADKLLVQARTVWACIGKDFKARSLPDEIKKALG
jgi:acyl-CoA thioester hydrolase